MRLKTLTNLNTLLLVTVCIALGMTLWWSQRALERPYQLMERYLSLSQDFQQQVANDIDVYLASGDATRHSSALHNLDALAPLLAELPADLATDLQRSLAEGEVPLGFGDHDRPRTIASLRAQLRAVGS